MSIAAVPSYLQKDDPEFYLSAPPGHRFLLYFAAWGENQEENRIDWRTNDRVPKMKREGGGLVQGGWDDLSNDQHACAIAACKTPSFDEERPRRRKPKTDPGLAPWRPLIQALRDRQTRLFETVAAVERLCLDAKATAPFTTGLGNEHPLENGFAFLNPYGLPYLPGSGVKGVLRQAARELTSGDWGDAHG
ncbi:RAMP superfamily CRISPR-associated protein, partial [Immundisolibacter sp.]|uniref:RAMP superfamily CRISPR-associated protein n=1 Tax=Immundisolibacter sp. TaxID=1934948 RepID=UPI00262D0BA2